MGLQCLDKDTRRFSVCWKCTFSSNFPWATSNRSRLKKKVKIYYYFFTFTFLVHSEFEDDNKIKGSHVHDITYYYCFWIHRITREDEVENYDFGNGGERRTCLWVWRRVAFYMLANNEKAELKFEAWHRYLKSIEKLGNEITELEGSAPYHITD